MADRTYRSQALETIIRDRSGAFLDELEKKAKKVFREVGRRAVMEAQARAPESENLRTVYRGRTLRGADAEHLKDTIQFKVKTTRGIELKLLVGAEKFTAHFIELGTESMPPRPFIAPALELAAADYEHLIVTEAMRIRIR